MVVGQSLFVYADMPVVSLEASSISSLWRLYHIRPRVIRLDAAYWGLRLIAWIHAMLGAVAVIPWNPKSQKNRSCLPPTWTKEELGKRSGIERFFGRVFLFFHLQRPPLSRIVLLMDLIKLHIHPLKGALHEIRYGIPVFLSV